MNKNKKLYSVFISLFVLLNIINGFILTIPLFNKHAVSFSPTFIGIITAFLGNLAILGVVFFLIVGISKKAKNQMKAMIIVTFALNLFVFALGIYNKYYGTSFSLYYSLEMFKNPAGDLGASIFFESLLDIILYYRIIYFIPFITLLTLYFVKPMKEVKVTNYNFISGTRKIGIILSSLLLVFTTGVSIKTQLKKWSWGAGRSTFCVQNMGIYNYYIAEAMGYNFLPNSHEATGGMTDEELFNTMDKYNKNKDSYTNMFGETISKEILTSDIDLELSGEYQNETRLNGIFKDKNIVLVHLESLSSLIFDPRFEDAITSKLPNFRKLREESYFFSNYFTSVGIGNSSDAEMAILTGLYANGYETAYWRDEFNFSTLPKYFNERNYYSEVINADPELFYNKRNTYNNNMEFDNFKSLEDLMALGYNNEKYNHPNPWLSEFAIIEALYDSRQEIFDNDPSGKYFLYPMTIMPHIPYLYDPYAPDSDKGKFPMWDDQLTTTTRRYLNLLEYYDEIIGGFLKGHENQGVFSDAVYVFYGDHGATLDENDIRVMCNDRNMTNEQVREFNVRVPAFIYSPGTEKDGLYNKGQFKGEQNMIRNHQDIHRTILELFDLPTKSNAYFGVNGLSKESSFSIDAKTGDIYIQGLDGQFNYRKNYLKIDQHQYSKIIKEIILFKTYADYFYNEDRYQDLNKYLNRKKN